MNDNIGSYQFTFTPTPAYSGTDPTAAQPNTQTRTQTTTTTQAGVNAYDGDSGYVAGDGLPLSFSNQRRNFDSPSGQPVLDLPNDDEMDDAETPLDRTGQSIVRRAYTDKVVQELTQAGVSADRARVIVRSLLNPSAETDLTPEETQLGHDADAAATLYVQQQAGLPSTWTIGSTNANDWIATPTPPYDDEIKANINQFYNDKMESLTEEYIQDALAQDPPTLTQEQAQTLRDAARSGVRPSGTSLESAGLRTAFDGIAETATTQTIEEFDLPTSWIKGTDAPENWTPVNGSLINPTTVVATQTRQLIGSLEQFRENFNSVIERLASDPNADVSNAIGLNRVGLADFLLAVSTALQALKSTLSKIQEMNAEKETKNTQVKFDQNEAQRTNMQEQFDKQKEQNAKAKKMDSLGLSMKIVGPIVAALSTLAAILITAASLGTLTPVGVAIAATGISIGIAMTAYSIADSVLGLSGKFMKDFGEKFEAALDTMSGGKAGAKLFFRIFIVAALVAVLVAIAAVGGAGASTAVGTSVATQAATQAAVNMTVQMAQQLVLQALIMPMVMSPAGFSGISTDILNMSVKDPSDKQKMAAQITGMVIGMIAIVAAMGIKPSSTTGAASSASGTVDNIRLYMQSIIDKGMDSVEEAVKMVVNDIIAQMRKFIDNLMKIVENALESASNSISEMKAGVIGFANAPAETTANAIRQQLQAMKAYVTDFLEGFKIILSEIVQLLAGEGNIAMRLANVVQAFKSIGPLTNMITATWKSVILFKTAKMMEELGDLKASGEITKAAIVEINIVIQKFQESFGSATDFKEGIQRMMNQIFQAANRSGSKMNAATTGGGAA